MFWSDHFIAKKQINAMNFYVNVAAAISSSFVDES